MNSKNRPLVSLLRRRIVLGALSLAMNVAGYSCAQLLAAEPLGIVETIPLPGVEGRIDHMALDATGQRLLVAALGNNTIEVVDLAAHKVSQSIRGLREPQGVAFLKDLGLIAVANGDDGSVRFFDA